MKQSYIIETEQSYLSNYFQGYEIKKITPASTKYPHVHCRYDFRQLGTTYNVYTKKINELEKVTSIWDRTSSESIDTLEVVVNSDIQQYKQQII